MITNLDLETRSAADLRKVGAHRYASDPSARIILLALSRGGGAPEVWDAFADDKTNAPAMKLIREMLDDDDEIYSFNYGFEQALFQWRFEKDLNLPCPDFARFRCSAALCRVAAIPGSLEKAGEFLKLDILKSKAGKSLIKYFSLPQKSKEGPDFWINPDYQKPLTIDGTKMSAKDAWSMFRDYCKQDVVVEQRIHERLKSLDLKGESLDAFLSRMRMNIRGIPVNVKAVEQAEKLVAAYQEKVGDEFLQLTGLKHTQGAKLLEWLKARNYKGEDLRTQTVAKILEGEILDEDDELIDTVKPEIEGMTPEAVKALRLRALLSFAALKKLPAFRNAACPDNRLRGLFLYHGAVRTGRDTSSVAQLHNLRRPTVDATEEIYDFMRSGNSDADTLDLLYGPPLECVSSCIRHFIDPQNGPNGFFDSDLKNIEMRVACWLSGYDEMLEAFRQGHDFYKVTASKMFGIPYDSVSKEYRFYGKVSSLACTYSGGVNAFQTMSKLYGVEFTEEKCEELVKAFREGNQPIVKAWKAMQTAALAALEDPGKWHDVNDKLSFGVTRVLGYPSLVMRLPSGRKIQYPYPQVTSVYRIKGSDKKWREIKAAQAFGPDGEKRDGVWVTREISYFGPQKGSVAWGRVRYAPGTSFENACQAVASDFLNHSIQQAENKGYMPVANIHDQSLFTYDGAHQSVEELEKVFCIVPKWAKRFPLEADVKITPTYVK